MTNSLLEKNILRLIAQSHAISYEKIELIYKEINSFDKILDILVISRNSSLSIEKAIEVWKENQK